MDAEAREKLATKETKKIILTRSLSRQKLSSMAGGSIGLIASLVVVGGLVLAGYLIYYLPPYDNGFVEPGGDFRVPALYFVPFLNILLFLSILCATFLIFTFAVFGDNGKVRTYPIKLIMFLCVSLIIAFTCFLIASQPPIVLNYGACYFIAVMIHFGFVSNFCWTFCIAFNFYRMIVAQDRDTRSYEKWYHAVSWGFPALLVILLVAIGEGTEGGTPGPMYGRLGGSFICYINNQVAVLLAFFVPGLLIVAANCVLFVFVAREIRETLRGAAEIRGAGEKKDLKRQLRVYVSIVFSIGLAWLFGFVASLLNLITDTKIPFQIFDVLFNVFVPLQGFFLFGSYCINEKIFKKYAQAFGKVFPCCQTVVSKLDYLATASTTGTSGSKTGSQSKTGSSTKSTASSRSDIEMQSGSDSRF